MYFLLFSLLVNPLWAQDLSLNQRIQNELEHPKSEITPEVLTYFSGKHIVLVDGIMHELAQLVQNYYRDNIKAIKGLKISYSHLGFPSNSGVPENSEALYRKLVEIYSHVHKPLILIGHSMGGAEVAYLNLKHPELMLQNIVDCSVVIEGAIGGSELAEDIRSNIPGQILKKLMGPGIETLSQPKARSNFEHAFDDLNTTLWRTFGDEGESRVHTEFESLSKRLFYVTSALPKDEKLSLGLKIVLSFINHPLPLLGVDEENSNDGLLYVEDQIFSKDRSLVPSFGIHFLDSNSSQKYTLKADHIELVVAGWFSNSDRKTRAAFTYALLRAIFEERNLH